MFDKKDLYRWGISFVIVLTVAALLSVFESDDEPADKRRRKKKIITTQKEEEMSSSTAALMVSAPILSIGKPDSTKLPERNESELQNDTNEQDISTEPQYLSENVNEKYYRMKFGEPAQSSAEAMPSHANNMQPNTPSANGLDQEQLILQNADFRETITCLQVELEKQRSYVNSERQGRIFAENQSKAESRLRAEAEEVLRLQIAESLKQRESLEAQLQNERRRIQQLQEKQHILEAKLTYIRTKEMEGQTSNPEPTNDVYT